MKKILILRGIPGSGKSTFIKQNNLQSHTLCPDDLRIICGGFTQDLDGLSVINNDNERFVWKMFYDILEQRMQNKDFLVIDSTCASQKTLNTFLSLCEKYCYEPYLVDFNVDIETARQRNQNRESYKYVPPYVIERMYKSIQNMEIPTDLKVISPNEINQVWEKQIDLSSYKKINHIGDIHGCFSVLKEAIGELKDDEYYIFLGDYIDRGKENAEVMEFMLSIMNNPNVCLLEGNHERHLLNYVNKNTSKSLEFLNYTVPELEKKGIDKERMAEFYSSLKECIYYKWKDKDVLVTHGGVSKFEDLEQLTKISGHQLIKGVGGYEDMEKCNASFSKNTTNIYQVHGHRNVDLKDTQVNSKCFNLCDEVEFGLDLRTLSLDENGFTPISTRNYVYKYKAEKLKIEELVQKMRNSEYIREKQFGDISSFNFTKKAFNKGIWDDITLRARGLYINTKTNKIVARGYDKFFNIGENEDVTIENLKEKLKFPITAYKKENGFLGIVGYDTDTNKLIITSKSELNGDFAKNFESILLNTNDNMQNNLINLLKDGKHSLVFECIDPQNDPHIIEYNKKQVVLLDCIDNKLEFNHKNMDDLKEIAIQLGVRYKEKSYIINDFDEFKSFINQLQSKDYKHRNQFIEGFVFEDKNGLMIKQKTEYYKYWKIARGICQATLSKGYIKKEREENLNGEYLKLYNLCQKLYNSNYEGKTDIITIKKMYELEKAKENGLDTYIDCLRNQNKEIDTMSVETEERY